MPVIGILPTDHRCSRTCARNRVCVPVNEFPASALQSKHAGHADRYRRQVLGAADFGPAPLDFDDAGERFGDVLRDEFDLGDLDLGSLTDMAFDATYDLIGSDPAEHSWWQDLASDHNHDGAYETISADDPYAAL